MHPIRITIGIQARSTSTRLPGKINMDIGHKSMLAHTIERCSDALGYLNRSQKSPPAIITLALCIPYGDDEIKSRYYRTRIVEGPEDDVLERYKLLAESFYSDYIVRITSDCPFIPSPLISTIINKAIKNQYDYFSNVDERCRTAPDGWDVEVISRKLLDYTCENAKDPKDREHVTTYMRSNPPTWAKVGTLVGFINLAHLKFSVDTQEDLERLNQEYTKSFNIMEKAKEIYGQNIARF